MATIDKLDLSVYNLYAVRTKMMEQHNEQLPLDKASSIHTQAVVIDYRPKINEVDILLGGIPNTRTPISSFDPPPNFLEQRRPSFAFSRIVPSLGLDGKQLTNEKMLAAIQCLPGEEESEKAKIASCLNQISNVNGMLGFIIGRVGQFLQG